MITEQKILINGLNVNYKVAGEGQPILILHGWGSSSDSWSKIQETLAKKGYFVVCPDLPGFGKSETPPEPWTLNNYAKLVIDFSNSQNLRDFYLIAHSFGGRIAVKLTTVYAERIRKLILCDSAGIKIKPEIKTKIILLMSEAGNAVFSLKPFVIFKDFARNFFYCFLRYKDYVKANSIMRETMKKVLVEDLLPEIPKIKNKTLIVWGDKDKMVPVKYAYLFKEKISDSRLEIFPKVGHSPHLEVPGLLSEKILNFLKNEF